MQLYYTVIHTLTHSNCLPFIVGIQPPYMCPKKFYINYVVRHIEITLLLPSSNELIFHFINYMFFYLKKKALQAELIFISPLLLKTILLWNIFSSSFFEVRVSVNAILDTLWEASHELSAFTLSFLAHCGWIRLLTITWLLHIFHLPFDWILD